MQIPAGYLQFSQTEPADDQCVEKNCVRGTWVALCKPINQWPAKLAQEYQQDLYFLFPNSHKSEAYNSRDVVTLCATVQSCPHKQDGALENRSCKNYRRGLCIEASMEANDCEPLALGSIARFHGLSKQRVHQIYNSARKKLILNLAEDEVIKEYLADIFMGTRDIPSPDQIAEFIEQAVSKSGG